MKYLIDADLLLEALLNRLHFSEEAKNLWEFLEKEEEPRGYVTAIGQDKILSICAKLVEADDYDDVAYSLESIASSCPVDVEVIQHARSLKLKDFESAVEAACVEACDLDGVVTQSPENFEGGELQVLSVKEFLLQQSSPSTLELSPVEYFTAHNEIENSNEMVSDDSIGKSQPSGRSAGTLEADNSRSHEKKIDERVYLSHRDFVYESLHSYQLSPIYSAEDIIKMVYERSDETIDISTLDEVHHAWFKTTCLSLLDELSRSHSHKNQFNDAIEKLFERQNPEARSLWASIERMLWQYRLRGAYDVKDVVIEAYAIGVKQIEKGSIIENPLPWMRGTCFNVVRDLRRKQDKAENPKLDSEGCTMGDEAWVEMLLLEDLAVMHLALQELSSEEQALLSAKYIEGRSWQQISDELNCSEENCLNANTVRQRGYRALQKLKQAYEDIREG